MEAARPATDADVPALVGLARAAVAELSVLRGGAVWRDHVARQEPLDAGLLHDVQMAPNVGLAVVGTIDDVVVGYGVSHLESLADASLLSVITDLYVDPEARGIGLGEAMANLLIDHATGQGAIGIDSMALPGDRATKNFFETFGLKARSIVVHRSLLPPVSQDGREGQTS